MSNRRAIMPRDIPELSDVVGLTPSLFRDTYNRLSDAPLKVFIGEFLLRNAEFHHDCRHFLKAMPPGVKIKAYELKMAMLLAQKYGAFVSNWGQVARREESRFKVKLLQAVRGFKVVDTATAQDDLQILLKKRSDALSEGDFEKTEFLSVRDTSLNFPDSDQVATVSDRLPALDYLMGGNSATDGRYPFDNLLLLSVDLSRPRHEVDNAIKQYLDAHLVSRLESHVNEHGAGLS